MLTSCDMDVANPGVEDDITAVQGAKELLACRNGLYSQLRSLTSGSYVTSVELQMDQFNGVNGNGTRAPRLPTVPSTRRSALPAVLTTAAIM